ncbi:MAG TPA: phenylalanine--tRNA ligase subunit alpha, partial [Acidimicrobiia bacterium]|nr:phenylalanine--tRNA ligase subunit alpha [Acidimicrobiia bacterium]
MTLAELEALLASAGDAVDALAAAATLDELVVAERALVGRGGPMSRANEGIKDLDPSERPAAGKAV